MLSHALDCYNTCLFKKVNNKYYLCYVIQGADSNYNCPNFYYFLQIKNISLRVKMINNFSMTF